MSNESNFSSRSSSTKSLICDGDYVNDAIKAIEGDKIFLATDLRPGTFAGSEKLSPCETMTIFGMVKDGIERTPVSIRLFLHRDYEWKLAAFFRCLGLKQKGVPYKVEFSDVLGRQGKVHVRPKTYVGKDGNSRTYNEIDRFYDFDPSFFEDDEVAVSVEETDSEELAM